ncbi:DUF3159 domain-containing protein [Tomitella fengzijianii]|uniref:DUF3159 domain-containing protein n=1 Tax=Tomitella fengzijianii TaxID=2597660 RepID=A0A516X829_9ACTN|nr:DUF3159 domain-containing protein [Tomitella fengzijianii]QDQ99225.1 DUF3159 domain-containing protein [Tomitella fengzijianii]
MGGIGGLVYSTLPILVFVPVNALWSLQPALYAALGVAAAILLWRLVRGEKIQPAVSGFIGVGICAYIAHRTGTAKGYFLFGIYTSLVYGGVFLLSVLVRWPLVGVIWNGLNGISSRWRTVRRARTLYDVATIGWAVVFAARYLVQSQLYDSDQTGWLAFARVAMGWPLAAVALLVTFYAIRRADAAVFDELGGPEEAADDEGADDEGAGQESAGQDGGDTAAGGDPDAGDARRPAEAAPDTDYRAGEPYSSGDPSPRA